jgi:hypothetical protein
MRHAFGWKQSGLKVVFKNHVNFEIHFLKCGFAHILHIHFIYLLYLGSVLLHTTNDDEMTKINKGLHLRTLLFLDIYI